MLQRGGQRHQGEVFIGLRTDLHLNTSCPYHPRHLFEQKESVLRLSLVNIFFL